MALFRSGYRGKILTITSKGKKMVEIINEVSNEAVRDVLQNLSLQERQIVTNAFGLLGRALDKKKKETI